MNNNLARIQLLLKPALALQTPREARLVFIQQMVLELAPHFVHLFSSRAPGHGALIPRTEARTFPPLGVTPGSAAATVDEESGTLFDHLLRVGVGKVVVREFADGFESVVFGSEPFGDLRIVGIIRVEFS